MPHRNGALKLTLTGPGAAYLRVSDEDSDPERQTDSVLKFLERHDASIPKENWFRDEGWARDTADIRPDFQRLIKLAEAGRVRWIVVDQLDRFGIKDAQQLFHYLYRLRCAKCQLYDAREDQEWTSKDFTTMVKAVFEGGKSEKEPKDMSGRVLGAKARQAREEGRWQGGPVPLGIDIACYSRQTGKELWRVVFEGRDLRRKVYPDGRSERFDGKKNFPPFQETHEILRIAPTIRKDKLNAAIMVFKRYATESIGFTALARWLNKLGWRNAGGGEFQYQQVLEMLRNPVYLGFYVWNKWHFGKFHSFKDGRTQLEENYEEKGTRNKREDWVQSNRLFEPLVDLKTWNAVQHKLAKYEDEEKRTNAPRSGAQYLSGLLYCGNCGALMRAGPKQAATKTPRPNGHTGVRYSYMCGTWHRACGKDKDKEKRACTCKRNSVFQDEIEDFIERYLDECAHRIDILTHGLDGQQHVGATPYYRAVGADDAEIDDPLRPRWLELERHHRAFVDNFGAMLDYINDNDAALYKELWSTVKGAQEPTPERLMEYYRRCFQPDRYAKEIAKLNAAHSDLTEKCLKLTN
jgi:DNA invertase Pin-like site-specific DNA recombinase